MGYNVLSFDAAIADTANQQLLLSRVAHALEQERCAGDCGSVSAALVLEDELVVEDGVQGLVRQWGLLK